MVNSYVRVCGHMRVLDNKKSMTAFRIKLIRDFNEVRRQLPFSSLYLSDHHRSSLNPKQDLKPKPSLQIMFQSIG